MRWSQLRKRLRDRFADSIRRRVDLHQTLYRRPRDQEGECWLTIDGSRVLSYGSATYLKEREEFVAAYCARGVSLAEASRQALPTMNASPFMLLEEVNRDLFNSLDQSVELMRQHRKPLIRGLAVLDARLGKRRLASLDASHEDEFVCRLLRFRLEVEGVRNVTVAETG